MSPLADIARLNLLIELFSECANAANLEALMQVVARRLRWVIDFDRCTFVLVRGDPRDETMCWVATRTDETLQHATFADLPEVEGAILHRVLESGAPGGEPPGGICIPLQAAGRTLGAISLSSAAGIYTYRDMRLGHHAGQYLGSLISRLELEEETKRLSQRKDDLLALLSHELRNPLAPIVTAVHVLKARAAGEPSKELDVIERQAQHLVRLLDDLLDVARLTRGKVVLQRGPVELVQVVARAVEMVSPLFEERRHDLEVDVPSGLIVDADENRLAQVVSNLLSNAAHYTDVGGHVRVAAQRDDPMVAIEVSDDGIGIGNDALSDIFELFVQGPSRVGGQRGLGLGLVVVKQLTELHGGSVSVASAGDGCGTKFTVRIPVLPPGALAPVPLAKSILIPRTETSRRILLVDDNEDALDLLSTFLQSAGHQVATAHDGPDALALLDRYQPSVLVIDIGMPVMNGYELAARVRAHGSKERPYLVALTGYGQAADRAQSHAAGFDEHLVKPVDLAHLLRILARTGVHPE
jgi:signal transduction histidine kinase/ActR/RegA family two-component response regulator